MNARPLLNIAVVGAGLAGLSCAQTLLAAGHTVQVFEKSRGPSGRMSTRRADDAGRGPWQCDHGAQYFTARDAGFRAEVARWQEAGVAAPWLARLASFDGQDWTPSATELERFVGTPRMTAPAAWLVQQITRQHGIHARVQTQSTVSGLVPVEGGWQLSVAELGLAPGTFDAVLLAVPAPQAVPLLAPVAPQGAALAACARMRGSWAVMLRFDQPVSLPWDGVFVNAGPLRWVARDSSKPGRAGPETWLLHASPEWSEAHIEADALAVTDVLVQAFRALGGPAPVAATAHRWRYADTEPALSHGSWWDAGLRVGLCGDWLAGGKVEGAWLSGQSLAGRVLVRA